MTAQTTTASRPAVRMAAVTKRFPGVLALDRVDLDVYPGEVHVLVGENGAGKSTLMRILAGAQPPDGGTVELHGKPVRFRHPSEALHAGISMIYQELNLAPHLDAVANIFLGRERTRIPGLGWLDRAGMRARATEALASLKADVTLGVPVSRLGVAQQQMIEIAKAVSFGASVVIMDEPTAALSEAEIRTLFETVRRLRDAGTAIVYISHRLEEVLEIGDRITVLRDGERVETLDAAEADIPWLIRLMVGRDLSGAPMREEGDAGPAVLEVEGLWREGVLQPCSLSVRSGEILGVAGLVGSGRTELMRAIFGADRPSGGAVRVAGRELRPGSPRDAVSAGLALLPEDRKTDGLALGLSVSANVSLACLSDLVKAGFIGLRRERELAEEHIAQLDIRLYDAAQQVRSLSGGNQQKVLLARWLASQAKAFLFDEPTRGIDVGAKFEIYALMNRLTQAGAAVVMVSSYLPELIGMSDRIIVLRNGAIAGELAREEATQERIMHLAAVEAEDTVPEGPWGH